MNDEVTKLLGQSVMAVPEIYSCVAIEPEAFIHIAYRLQLKDLYLDATTHLLGQQLD